MRAVLIACACLGSATLAVAEDKPECMSPHTKFNLCARASEIQRVMATSLPRKLNPDITLTSTTSSGPLVIVNALWNMSDAEMEKQIKAGHLLISDFSKSIEVSAKNGVCGVEPNEGFVRLGGKIQYVYRTTDGRSVLQPLIERCP